MNTEELYNFIVDTHPQINGDFNQCVDIKAVFRTAGKYVKPNKIFYNDTEKQKEELQKFIDTLDASGRAYCLYYSVYTFNPEDKKTITKDNAQSTQMLCADFDHITESDFLPILEKLKINGIEPNYSIFSGHGFQIIYKLDKPSTDKELLAEFTDAMKANGYPVDEKIRDCARVMRMPFTVNNKDPEKPINTYIYSTHEGAYSLHELRNKLGMKKQKETAKEEPTAKKTPAETQKQDFTAYDDEFLQQTYTCISTDKLQAPIKAVLMGFRNGYTDKQIRGIVLYLRDYEGVELDAIISTVQTLASINTYNYTGDVIPDITRKVKSLFYHFDYKFNYDDLKEFGSMSGKVIDRSELKLQNSTLKEEISNKAFYVYLRLLLEKEYKHKIAFTIKEVSQTCNISERNIRTRLEELAKAGLLDKKRANKQEGGKYVYIISKFGIDKAQGFTAINISILVNFLEAVDKKIINETVLKFLLYIKRVVQGKQDKENEEGIALSQAEIAKQLNIKQNAVSMLWAKVEKLNATRMYPYITRGKLWIDKDRYTYYYEVKY
jgi:predicted transcriptional regulator/heat shock protein HslJ